MNLGRAVLNSGSWKKIWTNYPNWIYTVKIFYHDVTFSRFAVGRNTLPKLGLKLTISWKSSLKGPDLQQSMIKGQFTKNGTFINILAILRPIWPQLCMLNKSASHLRTSFLVLVFPLLCPAYIDPLPTLENGFVPHRPNFERGVSCSCFKI